MYVKTDLCETPPGYDGTPAVFSFGAAIRYMNQGKRVARSGWNGKGMWIAKQVPDAGSKMTLPYAYMKTADDQVVPWLAGQTDIFAEDWMVVA